MKRLVLVLLAGCAWPTMSIADRSFDAGPEASAPVVDADDDFIPCRSAADCPDPREADDVLCNLTRGECVECLSDQDCAAGETCDADGECDD